LQRKRVKGHLVLIGGAEDKVYSKLILQHFFQLSGGKGSRIVVLPTASNFPDVGELYCRIFQDWGASADVLSIENRADADSQENAKLIRSATGIFLTGGDQLKITSVLGGTRIAEILFRAYFDRGLALGGTSAGAAAMSSHMIITGHQGSIPRKGMVKMAPGLGLIDWVIIDQHFAQRERIGRLLSAIAHNPALLGIGIDEDTAIVVSPNRTFKVIGSGTVTIVDGSNIQYTNIYQITTVKPVVLVNVTLHVLAEGFQYNFQKRKILLTKVAQTDKAKAIPESLKHP
jgi:cyanophycinase